MSQALVVAPVAPAPPPRAAALRVGGAEPPLDDATLAALDAACAAIPRNYNFEVARTVSKLRAARATRVALQFPEGLLLYACVLADAFAAFAGVEAVIMGDVTYGACCVDDHGAVALGCDFLVHYGHSCLVPIGDMRCGLKVLYVFVDVAFDVAHLCAAVRAAFPPEARIALLGTIQFADALHAARAELCEGGHFAAPPGVAQAKPLSPGEVLGCTSPALPRGTDALVFVADGRFHLESAMIANPSVPAYRYDPYAKALTRERYDTAAMHAARRGAIARAAAAAGGGVPWGLILGTLGRQGNPAVLERLQRALDAAGVPHFTLLLAEISPAKLAQFGPSAVGAWVQVACPRLSIDWGAGFDAAGGQPPPLLTPYEAYVAIGAEQWRDVYPMDYYAKGSGPWTNYYAPGKVLGKAGAAAVGGGGVADVDGPDSEAAGTHTR